LSFFEKKFFREIFQREKNFDEKKFEREILRTNLKKKISSKIKKLR